MIITPEQVINAIIAIANPLIKEKIQRNETVIKLLQQFNLDPEHPPADFGGVYAYALVEYGVGKPKPCLNLFRQEAIKLQWLVRGMRLHHLSHSSCDQIIKF